MRLTMRAFLGAEAGYVRVPKAVSSSRRPVAAAAQADATADEVSDAPARRLLPRVGLAEVRDPAAHYAGLRPALIDTEHTEFGAQIRGFQRRTSPAALLASPLADDVVTAVHGREAEGASFSLRKAKLRDWVQPYVDRPATYGKGGASAYVPIAVNLDRPKWPEFDNFFPPVEPWHDYFMGAEPDAFPLDLLGKVPEVNTSLTLSLGVGNGQIYHWHGGNVFVQVHGEKKWTLFANQDLYAFFRPGARYERRKPCPFDPRRAPLFSDLWWRGPVDLPQPLELITRPGDALYLPTGTWHATWNLTDYTFGYTKVLRD